MVTFWYRLIRVVLEINQSTNQSINQSINIRLIEVVKH